MHNPRPYCLTKACRYERQFSEPVSPALFVPSAEPTQLVRQRCISPADLTRKFSARFKEEFYAVLQSDQRSLQTTTPILPLPLQMRASPPPSPSSPLKIATLLLDTWVIADKRHLYKYWTKRISQVSVNTRTPGAVNLTVFTFHFFFISLIFMIELWNWLTFNHFLIAF